MTAALLTLNAGSSSVKFAVYSNAAEPGLLCRGHVEGIGASPRFLAADAAGRPIAEKTWSPAADPQHAGAIEFILSWVRRAAPERIEAVGHRVVHGGERFTRPVLIDAEVLAGLRALVPLAPLHQPQNLAAIDLVARLEPDLPQVACFDTAFHCTQPDIARAIAIPRRFSEAGVRRYGFHGLSYEFIAGALPGFDPAAAKGRTIVAHLGNGASLCALSAGRSIATTMGFSALDGLVMGTRCGSIDPGVLLHLAGHEGLSLDQVGAVLYEQSGLLGVSGLSGDMRTLLASPDPRAREAVDLFVYRAAREIGSLAAALGGLDALVFTGGIGEHAAPVREAIGRASAWLGLEIDAGANRAGGPRLSAPSSRVAAWVIPTDEELMIARHTVRVVGRNASQPAAAPPRTNGGSHVR